MIGSDLAGADLESRVASSAPAPSVTTQLPRVR